MPYTNGSEVVEAFQMTMEHRIDNREWPAWLHAAWNKDRSEPGAVYPGNNPEKAGRDVLRVVTPDGVHLAHFGNLIVRHANGDLTVSETTVFADTYTPTE